MCDEAGIPDRSHDSSKARSRTRERLEQLAKDRDELDRQRKDLTEEMHLALRRAHDAGWSWSEIAGIAGYRSASAARSLASRVDKPPDPAPGGTYSVREAAEALGVTPQTVYAWIESGRVTVADDRPRGRRVFLPDDASAG